MISDMHNDNVQTFTDLINEDYDEMFQRHQIPQEAQDMIKQLRGHAHQKSHSKRHGKKHIFEQPIEDDDEPAEGEWNPRKEAYRMFAPGLWEQAEEARLARKYGRHGPMVMAAKKKDATAEWPKIQPMCPVMLFFIAASTYQIFRIKFLEKAEAKVEFLQKAKKLVKMTVKKQVEQAPVQQVAWTPVQTQVMVPQQVAPKKKCKKVIKQEQAKVMPLVQQVVMPIAPKFTKKFDDVETIPSMSESFDYSMEEPLVDAGEFIVEELSQTGITASKNSMM